MISAILIQRRVARDLLARATSLSTDVARTLPDARVTSAGQLQRGEAHPATGSSSGRLFEYTLQRSLSGEWSGNNVPQGGYFVKQTPRTAEDHWGQTSLWPGRVMFP
jgi:hypothetical protein